MSDLDYISSMQIMGITESNSFGSLIGFKDEEAKYSVIVYELGSLMQHQEQAISKAAFTAIDAISTVVTRKALQQLLDVVHRCAVATYQKAKTVKQVDTVVLGAFRRVAVEAEQMHKLYVGEISDFSIRTLAKHLNAVARDFADLCYRIRTNATQLQQLFAPLSK